jgi:hypothetical protein
MSGAAKMEGGKKVLKAPQNSFADRFSRKRGRGRPSEVVAAAVRNNADRLRNRLAYIWNELEIPLLAAPTEQEVANAVRDVAPGAPDSDDLIRLAPLILKVKDDPKFPKRQKARIHFLADSIGAHGLVTPRRSRDICREQRAADAHRHQILRYEYWIECSCGYEGHSQNHSCKECGAILYVPGIDSEFD